MSLPVAALAPNTRPLPPPLLPSPPADTPLIVFINAKSGGRVGPRLLTVLFRSLGQAQVVRRRRPLPLAPFQPGAAVLPHWGPRRAAQTPAHLLPFPCLLQYDLADCRPGPVLRTIWDNLTAAEAKGDKLAGHIRRCARLLHAATSSCGGACLLALLF